MLNLLINTQFKENYASHNEDYVHGVSESYWKFKGGSSYLITDIDFINWKNRVKGSNLGLNQQEILIKYADKNWESK